MKILEINKFNYLRRGAERHFIELVRLLKSKGNEVAVFAMDHPQNDFSPWKKYFVSYVGYGPEDSLWVKLKGAMFRFYSFEAKRKIKKLLDDFQPDVVHIHNIYHQISPSILAPIKKRGIPIVMTVHDNKLVYPHYLPSRENNSVRDFKFSDFVRNKKFKNSLVKSFLVALEFVICRYLNIYDKHIDLYISPSQFTKNKLIEGGIKAEKIVVLPHFSFQRNPDEKGEINLSEKYVLHFGSLSKDKGVDVLIKIFKELPEINLYLAGNIEEGLEMPKNKNIKHIGFQSPENMERLIKNSLFVVSASRLWETFGLVALETILNGKPFVGFSGEAFGEIVEDNKSGYLCKDEAEMKEKIEKLVNDPGLRILFGRNALERAEEFNRDKYYEKFTKVVDHVRSSS
jgi:glycosyltransferase involved in cell wall biosynthesis